MSGLAVNMDPSRSNAMTGVLHSISGMLCCRERKEEDLTVENGISLSFIMEMQMLGRWKMTCMRERGRNLIVKDCTWLDKTCVVESCHLYEPKVSVTE